MADDLSTVSAWLVFFDRASAAKVPEDIAPRLEILPARCREKILDTIHQFQHQPAFRVCEFAVVGVVVDPVEMVKIEAVPNAVLDDAGAVQKFMNLYSREFRKGRLPGARSTLIGLAVARRSTEALLRGAIKAAAHDLGERVETMGEPEQ